MLYITVHYFAFLVLLESIRCNSPRQKAASLVFVKRKKLPLEIEFITNTNGKGLIKQQNTKGTGSIHMGLLHESFSGNNVAVRLSTKVPERNTSLLEPMSVFSGFQRKYASHFLWTEAALTTELSCTIDNLNTGLEIFTQFINHPMHDL